MNVVVAVLFAALWLVVVFRVARELLTRVFSDPQRTFVAAAFSIALFAGAALPRVWIEIGRKPLEQAGAPAPIVSAVKDVSGVCRNGFTSPGAGFGQGSLDAIYAGSTALPATAAASRRTGLHFIGWTAADARTASSAACLMVDGRPLQDIVSLYGGSRPDVATALSDPDLTNTGFDIVLSSRAMPANGKHVFAVVSLASNGKATLVYQPRAIVIRP